MNFKTVILQSILNRCVNVWIFLSQSDLIRFYKVGNSFKKNKTISFSAAKYTLPKFTYDFFLLSSVSVSIYILQVKNTEKISHSYLMIFSWEPWVFFCSVLDLWWTLVLTSESRVCLRQVTVCPRSLDPIFLVTYLIKWAKISWTDSSNRANIEFLMHFLQLVYIFFFL